MRLQVLLSEQEMAELQKLARAQGLTLGEWVRRELRAARQRQSTKDPEIKLAAMARAAEMNLPTADVEQMIAESQSGYLVDLP
ncbi:MAG: hypothetical protein ACTHJX_02925 [Terriglobales bacterium]|jgi:hypothetical protein